MGEKKEELRPKSFRIKDETASRIKEIAQELGGNQQECLAKLIECYEMQSAKSVMVGKRDEIDKFEGYLNAISRLYTGSLEDMQYTEERVRTEYQAQLLAKDQRIAELEAGIVGDSTVGASLSTELVKEELSSVDSEESQEIARLQSELEEAKAQLERERAEAAEMEAGIKEEVDKLKYLCEMKIQKVKLQMEKKHLEDMEAQKAQYEAELEKYRNVNNTLLSKYEIMFQKLQ